ncbi:MAG: hypothetical protein BGO43_02055 [Gammaproteobacteria bacterium 39-13]|nr:hypothetical protein [Gammaproteobacteria bacterium]OJV87335.1 MAG: hypothetical protein BGO43_02055 [Gammaproteobacteria bacterium 39-13]
MLEFHGDGIPDEVRLNILTALIANDNFPHSLLLFSLASRNSYMLSHDKHVWREALRFYFPFTENAHKERFSQDPYSLFKACYKPCIRLLKSEGLTFNDYINVRLNNWSNITAEKKSFFIGLLHVVGHGNTFDAKELNSDAEDHAIHCCAVLSISHPLVTLLLRTAPPIAPQVLRKAFVLAAENGFEFLTAYLMTHHHVALDKQSICDALLKGAVNGHLRLTQKLIEPPHAQIVHFSLPAVLKATAANGHVEVVKALIVKPALKTNFQALSDAIRVAVTNQHIGVVFALLQNPSLAKDTVLVIDLFKMSAANRSAAIVGVILTNHQIDFPILIISGTLKTAMEQGDEATAHILLEHKYKHFPLFTKRQLLSSAAEKGYLSLVTFLLENDPELFDQSLRRQAFRAAAANNRAEVMAFLRGKIEVQEDEIQILTKELETLDLKSPQNAFHREPLPSLHQYSGHVRRTINKIEDDQQSLNSSVKSNDKPSRGHYRGQVSKFM